MKKWMIAFVLALSLVGCGVEDSPEYYFDTALTEVENLEAFKTRLKIEVEGEIPNFTVSYEQKSPSSQAITSGPVISCLEDQETFENAAIMIAKFEYCNVFNDFSKEENVITCSIPIESAVPIVETAQQLTGEDVKNITHYMYLEDESLDYVEMLVETGTKTITYTIDLVSDE